MRWILVGLIVVTAIFSLRYYLARQNIPTGVAPTPTLSPTPEEKLSPQEKQRIEKWIKENNLNQYADPIDTVYTGGTPLFNEATGETINRFEYILKRHPDRPWNK